MPIYGYRCTNCGHQFEVYQKMADDPVEVCPKCQSNVIRVLYPTGVVFKGSGYYSTDYKASSSNGSESSSASTEGKPESKPDSKPESKSTPSD